jgi:hypothetical protein
MVTSLVSTPVEIRIWFRNWIVFSAICVHGIWGVLLLFSAQPLSTTPMGELRRIGQYQSASVYLFACVCAVCPLVVHGWERTFTGLLCLLPQQFLMMLSAFTAIYCVMRGSYFDGVPRAWSFILADQLWSIVGMTCHTFSLLDWFWWSRRKI